MIQLPRKPARLTAVASDVAGPRHGIPCHFLPISWGPALIGPRQRHNHRNLPATATVSRRAIQERAANEWDWGSRLYMDICSDIVPRLDFSTALMLDTSLP